MSINDFFGDCYLITLLPKVQKDKRWHELGLTVTERCERSVKQLREVGITPHYKWGITPADPGAFKTRGMRGCTESHLVVVKEAKQDKLESVLIAEDDLLLWSDFAEKWPLVEDALMANPWDLFYFYTLQSTQLNPDVPMVVRTDGEVNGHLYAVHSRFYDRYIAAVEEGIKQGKMQDETLCELPDKIVYAIHPPMAGQAAGYSSVIETDRPERFMPVERTD